MAKASKGPRPAVTKIGILDMQVCVPKDWTDEQVVEFAEANNPCGTASGWSVRKEGSEFLCGAPERVPCEGPNSREGFVHVMLDC